MSNSLPIAIFRFGWTNSANMAWEFAAPLPHSTTVPTRTMTYDLDNRLQTVDGNNVTVDNDGNLTSGPLTNDTLVSYGYDARNRLTSAGGVTNTYDSSGNRIGLNYGTNQTMFVVNPNAALPQVLMRIKNGVTNYYVYGPGLLYQVTETAVLTNTLTYHYDYRGSTIALSADNSLVTDRIEYAAYGLTTHRAGTSDTPFLFNGRYGVMSDPNGLVAMNARYYNPFLCRFISADPSGFNGGLNWYAYANGNPVGYVDPFGLGALSESTVDLSWFAAPTPEQQEREYALESFLNFVTLGVANLASEKFEGMDIYGNQVSPMEQNEAAIYLAIVFIPGLDIEGVADCLAVETAESLSEDLARTAADTIAEEGIATPYGSAVQATTDEAQAALREVQSGATVYRQGQFGVQNTTDAQFWSLNNPATTPGYAGRMGMPAGSTTPDWIMGGTVRPGASVITRPAPAGPGGVNHGGNIEAVVNPGGVQINWFHMP